MGAGVTLISHPADPYYPTLASWPLWPVENHTSVIFVPVNCYWRYWSSFFQNSLSVCLVFLPRFFLVIWRTFWQLYIVLAMCCKCFSPFDKLFFLWYLFSDLGDFFYFCEVKNIFFACKQIIKKNFFSVLVIVRSHPLCHFKTVIIWLLRSLLWIYFLSLNLFSICSECGFKHFFPRWLSLYISNDYFLTYTY